MCGGSEGKDTSQTVNGDIDLAINSKSESRNTKQILNSKIECIKLIVPAVAGSHPKGRTKDLRENNLSNFASNLRAIFERASIEKPST